MDNNKISDDIDEILATSSNLTEGNATVTEFVFEVDDEIKEESGLVFDDSEEEEVTASIKTETPVLETPNITFETVNEEETRPVKLSVPKKFKVNKKYDTEISGEEAPRIITTYVPTFTGIGDSYRMVNDPRPRVEPKKTEVLDATKEYDEDIDPTAEIDENVMIATANTVKNGVVEDVITESVSTVFKFADNEIPVEVTTEETVVEEPVIEVIKEENDEETVEKTREIIEDVATLEPKHEYEIPDPEIDLTPFKISDTIHSSNFDVRNAPIDPPADIGDAIKTVKHKKEYASYAQRESCKDSYLDGIMSVRVRFFAAAFIALLIVAVEVIYAMGVNIPALLNIASVPGAMALIDIQFVSCIFLISLPETLKGISKLLHGKAVGFIYLPITFILLIVYTVLTVIASPRDYLLLGSLFAVFALSAIGGTYYGMSADFTAFKLISKNCEKKIIDNKYTRTLVKENAALDGAVEEHKSRLGRLYRTVFVSDFYARIEKCAENSGNIASMLGISFGAAAVTGGVAFLIVPGGIVYAVSAALMVFMTAFPAVTLIAKKQSYYKTECEMTSENSAVIGESEITGCSEIDVLTFDDTEVFGPDDVTLQRIMLYGKSENLSKALRQMSALFIKVGGPLNILFSKSLDRKCPPANCVEFFENGITGQIDGVPVAGGNLKFMREMGMFIPDDSGKPEMISDSTRVMYAAENGKVYAKFYIRYSFSEEFSMLLPTLDDEKIKLLVYTRDPGINAELMKHLTAGADKIRVLKRSTPLSHDNPIFNQVSAAAVTLGDKNDAISMLFTAKKYTKICNNLSVGEHVALILGAVISAAIAIGAAFIVSPAVLAVWQALWCLVTHLVIKKKFPKNKG